MAHHGAYYPWSLPWPSKKCHTSSSDTIPWQNGFVPVLPRLLQPWICTQVYISYRVSASLQGIMNCDKVRKAGTHIRYAVLTYLFNAHGPSNTAVPPMGCPPNTCIIYKISCSMKCDKRSASCNFCQHRPRCTLTK